MIKKIGIIILALLITAGLGIVSYYYVTTPRQEGVCKLKTVSSVPYLYEYDIVHFFRTSDKKPESLSDFPEDVDGQKLFFTIPFTNRQLNGCLVDHGQKRYTVYIDLNGNNSLADEKPLDSRKKKYSSQNGSIHLFGPATLKQDVTVRTPFYLFLTNFTGGIHIAPTTVAKGKIRVDGKIHKVMLADLDFDG
ncbi:MAG: hypothetical protein KAS23_15475, partial [Anaerohalosphaera sp.]|nr:hypothetical protein [Anaerohalosphaera sp.]